MAMLKEKQDREVKKYNTATKSVKEIKELLQQIQ